MDAPLKGIRIIDWTIWQQGPVATAMLADMGAEVIKIEERGKGDPGRGIMSMGGSSSTAKSGTNYYFEANNRHKHSIVLDLSKPDAREIVYRLAEKSDVFVQNFRKGVADRLGLGYKNLSARNPKIIYANSTGYGPYGPDSGEPSFDYMAQARSGIMNIACLKTDEPIYLTGGIADQMGAIMLAYGVMTALVARERQGVGQEIHASHLGSMIALQGLNVSMRSILGKEMPRAPRDDAYNPLWNHYRCADGLWLCLGMLQTDRYWKDFCVALGIPECIEDERFKDMRSRTKNHRDLVVVLDRVFMTKPRAEWLKILKEGGDFIYTIVNKITDLPDDPQVLANGYVVDYEHPALGTTKLVGVPVILSQTPGDPHGRAPELGEHTETVLTELLGYSWDDVAKFQEAGVI
ncbi:MAG TPA: CoA transferase [Candidatus Binataceae bacterium]|nr:CoA transferase [Candidatus Binataceae bacterium]